MRRIGTIYFNIQEKKQQKPQGGLMGMIQNMMSELGGGGMGDSDDDSDDNQSGILDCGYNDFIFGSIDIFPRYVYRSELYIFVPEQNLKFSLLKYFWGRF